MGRRRKRRGEREKGGEKRGRRAGEGEKVEVGGRAPSSTKEPGG